MNKSMTAGGFYRLPIKPNCVVKGTKGLGLLLPVP